MRLIDADALLSSFDVRKVVEYDESGCGMDYKAVPVEAIVNAPTIDAEPVRHGRWEGKKWSYSCSICGGLSPEDGGAKTNYCPDCGAKMDVEVQDE